MSRIAVAMSGGVDSSVAAALLQQQGHQVIGITMQLFAPEHDGAGTPAHDGALVAAHLGVPHHLVRLETPFREQIIDNFIDEYRRGRTPNPCVLCNRRIKFGLLLEAAQQLGAELLATGHYAEKQVDPDGTCHLQVAANRAKDQSYFLYGLQQEQLRRVLFPLGGIASKEEVRCLATAFNLPVADKGDSQEVCFVPHDDYVSFLEAQGVRATGGKIVHVSGTVLGHHRGTHCHTIGQRKGLGIGWSEPLYVVAIDALRNLLVVGEQQHVFAPGLVAEELNWITPPPALAFDTSCKIRYRHQPVPCHVRIEAGGHCRVRFQEPQKSVTPGQSVVFYQGDRVLGGGIITSSCDRFELDESSVAQEMTT